MGYSDLNPFLQMRKLKQPKFNDLTRSELANDGKCSSSPTALSQTFLLDRGRVFGTRCFGNKNSRITLCLSLLPVSLFTQGHYCLFSSPSSPSSLPFPFSFLSLSVSTWISVYSRVKCTEKHHYKVVSPTLGTCGRDPKRETVMRLS